MDKEQFETLLDKLDKITRLLAIETVKGQEREQDKIDVLDSLGFRPGEIAKMLNKTPENVSVVLGNIRKKKAPAVTKIVQQPTSSPTVVPSPPPNQP